MALAKRRIRASGEGRHAHARLRGAHYAYSTLPERPSPSSRARRRPSKYGLIVLRPSATDGTIIMIANERAATGPRAQARTMFIVDRRSFRASITNKSSSPCCSERSDAAR